MRKYSDSSFGNLNQEDYVNNYQKEPYSFELINNQQPLMNQPIEKQPLNKSNKPKKQQQPLNQSTEEFKKYNFRKVYVDETETKYMLEIFEQSEEDTTPINILLGALYYNQLFLNQEKEKKKQAFITAMANKTIHQIRNSKKKSTEEIAKFLEQRKQKDCWVIDENLFPRLNNSDEIEVKKEEENKKRSNPFKNLENSNGKKQKKNI